MDGTHRMSGTGSFRTLPPPTDRDRQRLLTDLLRRVSRSFYLTLRVLPKAIREPIGVAYLLARAADTIADTRALPPDGRLARLLEFRAQLGGPADPAALRRIGEALRGRQPLPEERELIASLPKAFALLEATPEPDKTLVASIVETLTRGMEIDLNAFPPEDSGLVRALGDAGALDNYIYYVAGCVGEFWTRITAAHADALKAWDVDRISETGVRFGKALQLTNVLRDIPADLRIGRCYLPEADLSAHGIGPADLLDPCNGPKARPVLLLWMQKALEHYRAAEEYLLAIPRRCLRLRLAALWPILIGLGTLSRLARNERWLDPRYPSKIPRPWVYRTVVLSLFAGPSNLLLRVWIRKLRRTIPGSL